MIEIPPPRPLTRMLLLAIALVAAACGSVRPSPSPAASPDAVGPSAPPATVGPSASPATAAPPAGDPLGGLLALRGGELLLVDPDGSAEPVAGPIGGPVELASAAGGVIVVKTADQVFHAAPLTGVDVPPLAWRTIEIDPRVAQRPPSVMALSPDTAHLAIVAANFGEAEPFEVLLVDLETAATRALAIDREPNGPPVWLGSSTVLLEVVAGAAGGPFLRLDVGSGTVEAVPARGFGPAIAADGASVALPDAAGGVHLLSTDDWLAGADPGTGEAIGAPDHALQVAVASNGGRLALIAADSAGSPASLAFYRREEGGWALAGRITDEATRWIGWLR